MIKKKVLTLMLASAFIVKLGQAIRPDQFEEACRRNAKVPADVAVCHSHDFCDANMVMHEAWVYAMGKEPNINDEQELELWNAAWAMAFTWMAHVGRDGATH